MTLSFHPGLPERGPWQAASAPAHCGLRVTEARFPVPAFLWGRSIA
jgi:hypothetical protein